MTDTTNKPVIFLAFTNDCDDTVGYLRNLPDEARRLRDVLARSSKLIFVRWCGPRVLREESLL